MRAGYEGQITQTPLNKSAWSFYIRAKDQNIYMKTLGFSPAIFNLYIRYEANKIQRKILLTVYYYHVTYAL